MSIAVMIDSDGHNFRTLRMEGSCESATPTRAVAENDLNFVAAAEIACFHSDSHHVDVTARTAVNSDAVTFHNVVALSAFDVTPDRRCRRHATPTDLCRHEVVAG